MAHLAKFRKAGLGQLMAHLRRGTTKESFDRNYSNEQIDVTKSHLNYALIDRADTLSDYQYIVQRSELYNALKRDNVVMVGMWAVTLPEQMKDKSEEVQRRFFEETLDFMKQRYGIDNIACAYVHMDETTPHMHVAVTPAFYDKKKGRNKYSFKEFFSRNEYGTFHKHLSAHLEKVFGYDTGVWNKDTTDRESNKTIKELKQESARQEREIKRLEQVVADYERQAQDSKSKAIEYKKEEETNEALKNQAYEKALDMAHEVNKEMIRLDKAKEIEKTMTIPEKMGLKAYDSAKVSFKDEIQKEVEFRLKQERVQMGQRVMNAESKAEELEKENRVLKYELREAHNTLNSYVPDEAKDLTIKNLRERNKVLEEENKSLRGHIYKLCKEFNKRGKEYLSNFFKAFSRDFFNEIRDIFREERKEEERGKESQER